jgi:ATP synthase protein I
VKQIGTTWKHVGDALQLGASIVLAIFIGFGIGYWLDNVLGTSPYLKIVFFFFGIGAAARNVWIEVRKQLRADQEKKSL